MFKQKFKNLFSHKPEKETDDTENNGISESDKNKPKKSRKSWSFRRTTHSKPHTNNNYECADSDHVTGGVTPAAKSATNFSRGGSRRSSGDSAFGSIRRKFSLRKPRKDQSDPTERSTFPVDTGQPEAPENPQFESKVEDFEPFNEEITTDDENCGTDREDNCGEAFDQTDDQEDTSRLKRFVSIVRNSLRLSKRSKDSGYYGSIRGHPKNKIQLEKVLSPDTLESLETVVGPQDDASCDCDSLAEAQVLIPEIQPVQPEEEDDWSIGDEPMIMNAAGGDVESIISDMEHAYCDSNASSVLQLNAAPVTKPHIKALFKNPKVYPMSCKTRGRVLILNNFRFYKNGIRDDKLTRLGTGADYENFARMFKSLHFDIAKSQRELSNLSRADMLREIKEETERPEHHQYGMFVLVIMTHGTEGNRLLDSNCEFISIAEMEILLAASEFPAMSGKPKLVIVIACSGDKPDTGVSRETSESESPPFPCPDVHSTSTSTMSTDGVPERAFPLPNQTTTKTFNAEEFCRMKSSSEPYTSLRDNTNGSWYVRVLVATFYKHACHRDIDSLCRIIQNRMGNVCRNSSIAQEYGGCVPTSHDTVTNYRKLYFFPGVHDVRRDKFRVSWPEEFPDGPETLL